MLTLVIAEKPSVARDIAAALGVSGGGHGCLRGGRYVVTWAIGHLVGIAEPKDMNPAWARWRLADLPLVPDEWLLSVSEGTREQFETVRSLLLAKDVSDVVCATDAGREGELIFRYIYEASGSKKPVRRLWLSALTPDAVHAGFANLKAAREFDRLADAARGRSRADWLVGMNLSRAYSLLFDEPLSVGRVQTPTLAMLVARELELRAFVPERYREVAATFRAELPDRPAVERAYEGVYIGHGAERRAVRFPVEATSADEAVSRALTGKASVESVELRTRRVPPPLLYDLTSLQRDANRIHGFTAQRTLDAAQALYERRKLISYPRTDSQHLPESVAVTLPSVVPAVSAAYAGLVAEGSGVRRWGDASSTTRGSPTTTPSSRRGRSLRPTSRRTSEPSSTSCAAASSARGTTTMSSRPRPSSRSSSRRGRATATSARGRASNRSAGR